MPQYFRSEERTATRRGDVLTAVSSHSLNLKAPPKERSYARRFWGEDVAAWFDSSVDGDEVQVVVHVTANSEGYVTLKDQPVLLPVSTPAGVKATLENSGGFVNPYTFVPTPPRDGLTGGPGATGLGDSGPAGPPSHSRIAPDEWTGRLTVRLTTVTPLLLPDTARATTDEENRSCFRTRVDDEDRPLIPGSSLKGALRSAFEIVTASRFGVLDRHDRRLAYRIPATGGLRVAPALVEDDGGGGRRFRLCLGDRAWRDPGKGGHAIQAAAWVPAYRGLGHHLRLVGGLDGPLEQLHGRPLAARVRLYQHNKRPFRVWSVTHLAPDRRALDAALAKQRVVDPTRRGSLTLQDGVDARIVDGCLSVTHHSIGNKHDERFFVRTENDTLIDVGPEHEEFWQSILDAYTEAKDYNTVPDGLRRSRHVDQAASLKGLPAGTPVYVEWDKKSEVTGVHPVMIGRKPFDRTPLAELDPSVQPAASPDRLSPADRVFGWVPSHAGTAGNGRRATSGYRGRLAVRTVTGPQQGWRVLLPDGGVVLAPLSSPKPTQFRFYAAKDGTGAPVPPGVEKRTGYGEEGGLRGRKVYRWPVVPDAYWQPAASKQDFATVPAKPAPGRPRRYREYLDPGAPESQTVRYLDWVRPGVTFEVELFLDGIPTAELGALLWLLDRGTSAPLRLGAGKPLGFGVLGTQVVWQACELRRGDAVADGWRSLERPAAASEETLCTLAAEFEATAARHPVLAEALTSYQKATAGIADHAVHYPRPQEEPQPESYAWFVTNEKTTKAGVMHGWALPHVRDPEQRLPYFTGDDRDRR